jgi:hypothetical protein
MIFYKLSKTESEPEIWSILAVSFIGGGNWEYPEKTTDLINRGDRIC